MPDVHTCAARSELMLTGSNACVVHSAGNRYVDISRCMLTGSNACAAHSVGDRYVDIRRCSFSVVRGSRWRIKYTASKML